MNQAEDAASKLSSLVRSSKVAQLLQRPLPAQPTAAHQAVLASCSNGLLQLLRALPDKLCRSGSPTASEASIQLLDSVLRHQAVHCAGVLLWWLQQQPQQLVAALQRPTGD
jgi:hypothetical protein